MKNLLHPTDSQDCGWGGITEYQCKDRGCAWNPGGTGAWCKLNSSTQMTTSIPDEYRVIFGI
jgi:hypothetical protein